MYLYTPDNTEYLHGLVYTSFILKLTRSFDEEKGFHRSCPSILKDLTDVLGLLLSMCNCVSHLKKSITDHM